MYSIHQDCIHCGQIKRHEALKNYLSVGKLFDCQMTYQDLSELLNVLIIKEIDVKIRK